VFTGLVLFLNLSFANPHRFHVDGDLVYADHCTAFESLYLGLSEWRDRADPQETRTDIPTFSNACQCSETGCWLDLRGLLPQQAQAILNQTYPERVNCWNTVLFLSGLAAQGPTSGQEFTTVAGNHCTRRPKTEALHSGDIVSFLRSDGVTPNHAWIYVSPHFGFHKEGADSMYRPTLVPTSELFRRHFWFQAYSDESEAPDPEHCISSDGYLSDECSYAVEVLSCQ
jgi:hypothetical protein